MSNPLLGFYNLLEDDVGYIEVLDVFGNDMTIVNAARVSYLGESKGPEKDRRLLHYLVRNKHYSPLEMCNYLFRVKCPLFVARQWQRHRMQNLNEVSRRYTSTNIEFYTPAQWRKQAKKNKQGSEGEFSEKENQELKNYLQKHHEQSLSLYTKMLERGVAREMARMVLPANLYTQFYSKMDLRNLINFIQLRADEHAQWEIRQYALSMLESIKVFNPWTYEVIMEETDNADTS